MTPTIHDSARALMIALAKVGSIEGAGRGTELEIIEAAMRKLLRDAAKVVEKDRIERGRYTPFGRLELLASEGEGESR